MMKTSRTLLAVVVLTCGLVAPATVEQASTANPLQQSPEIYSPESTSSAQQIVNGFDAGGNHTCAILTDGTLLCWGENFAGQVGDGTRIQRGTPRDVVRLDEPVVKVAVGGSYTCALTESGGVKCWGANYYGELGDGTRDWSNAPVDVAGLSSGVIDIDACGENFGAHSCALTESGGVQCWGQGRMGELGDGLAEDSSVPVQVDGLSSGVTAITTGHNHTCALTEGGAVMCWGANWFGSLGDGSTDQRNIPVPVVGLSSGVRAIVAGHHHTCAVLDGGTMQCWGSNGYGQLGDDSTTDRTTPVDVGGLDDSVESITAGASHTCAVTDAGELLCWGYNTWGQLGDGTEDHKTSPEKVSGIQEPVTSASGGLIHTCAQVGSGWLQCWGANTDGQLGDGTSTMRLRPVDVFGLSQGVGKIAVGTYHSCALTDSGGVKCWGSFYPGFGSDSGSSTPADVTGLSDGISDIAAGSHTCVLTDGGGVKCWGANNYGGVGDGTNEPTSAPALVDGLSSGVKSIDVGDNHSCALMDTGEVKCWGWNNQGQLGDDSTIDRFTPVDVKGLPNVVTAIAAGYTHTCALTDGGGVMCWGENSSGELGDGSFDQSSTPVPVTGLSSGVVSISAGGRLTCAVTDGGGAKCWGTNGRGQLGDGTTDASNIPVPVLGMASEVSMITVGPYHTCALLDTGEAYCWGDNTYGQIGDGTISQRTSAVRVIRIPDGNTAVAAGWWHTCAVTDQGGVMCWGIDDTGQLGLGTIGRRLTPVFITGLPFLNLPFQYGQDDVGLDIINAYFDHEYPLTWDRRYCEPSKLEINTTILRYDGRAGTGVLGDCDREFCYSVHEGTDFDMIEGAEIHAAASGTLTLAIDSYTKACMATVDHGNGHRTLYVHLAQESGTVDNPVCYTGSRPVNKGDVIGKVGLTGHTSGYHLHFEVRYDPDGGFGGDARRDPYGFQPEIPTTIDPWGEPVTDLCATHHYGGASVWLWEDHRPGLTLVSSEAGGQLETDWGVAIDVSAEAVVQDALLSVGLVPTPVSYVASGNMMLDTQDEYSIAVKPTAQLAASYLDGTPISAFEAPVTATFSYSDTDALYVEEDSIRLYRWDSIGAQWIPLSSLLNMGSNTVQANLPSPGLFSLRGTPLHPAPIVLSVSQDSGTSLEDVQITISGSGFLLTPEADLGLYRSLKVEFISSTVLSATVPAGLPCSQNTLTVQNPDSQIGQLQNAYQITCIDYLPLIIVDSG